MESVLNSVTAYLSCSKISDTPHDDYKVPTHGNNAKDPYADSKNFIGHEVFTR